MGVLPAAALLLFTAEIQGDVQAGATLSQRGGELPTGAAGGDSILSYDTVLRPELRLRLADDDFTASLFYDPRFLLRVRFPETGEEVLQAGDRPFLILHSVRGSTTYRIAPRWTWRNSVQGLIGEQDFALFAQQGAGAGGVAGGTPDSQVIQTASLNLVSTLVGPLVGHNDFRTTAAFNLSFPETEVAAAGGMPIEPAPGDNLCLGDAGEMSSPASAVLAGIADTCQMRLATATVHPLSAVDRLEFQGTYEAIDFDPGPFVNTFAFDVLWRRRVSRAFEGRLRGGAILAVEVSPAEGQDAVQPLPRFDLGFAWRIINLRLLQVSLDLGLGADGFVEPISRRYLLRAQGTAALAAIIRRDVQLALRVNTFTLGLDRDCPPRQDLMGVRTGGCPDDLSPEERMAELPDLSAFSTEASFTWTVDRNVSLLGTARYAFRAPHISRLGDPAATPGGGETSQREISAQIGLRVVYGTRNDLGS